MFPGRQDKGNWALLERVKEKGTVSPSPASRKQPLDVFYTVMVSCASPCHAHRELALGTVCTKQD